MALRRVRKSLAGRYYQLLSGHAAISSSLHEKMTGPLIRESSICRWRSCGKRESRHHLLVECKAWAPQIRRLWKRVGKDCGWKHPKAPAVRKLWKEGATEAILEFLVDVRAGCWSSAGAGAVRTPGEAEGGGQLVGMRFVQVFIKLFPLSSFSLSFVCQGGRRVVGDRGALV